MNESHEPDPRFVDALEGTLRAAVRRRETLDPKPENSMTRRLRTLRNLFVVAVSMFVGGAGTYAVTREDDAPLRELLTARGQAHVEIARMRLSFYSDQMHETDKHVEAGYVTEADAEAMRLQVTRLETDLAIQELRLEETQATGREPNDGISAPRVGQRDFVAQRLAAQRRPMEREIELLSRLADRLRKMAEQLIVSDTEVQAVAGRVAALEGELSVIDQRIALRQSFLSGQRTSAEIELSEMKSTTAGELAAAVRGVEQLRREHQRMQSLSERQIVSQSELRAVEVDLRSAELQVELVNLEMQILEARLAPATD